MRLSGMATTYARKDYPPIPEIRTIGVLGAGQMGSGIAEVAASAGYEVRLVDVAAPQLETALARLRTEHRIVLMHYSPIEGTVEGEPKEIYPYLGSSRLEEPLTRYPVDAVFHGHAHHGTAEGRTRTGVPVYNAASAASAETMVENHQWGERSSVRSSR